MARDTKRSTRAEGRGKGGKARSAPQDDGQDPPAAAAATHVARETKRPSSAKGRGRGVKAHMADHDDAAADRERVVHEQDAGDEGCDISSDRDGDSDDDGARPANDGDPDAESHPALLFATALLGASVSNDDATVSPLTSSSSAGPSNVGVDDISTCTTSSVAELSTLGDVEGGVHASVRDGVSEHGSREPAATAAGAGAQGRRSLAALLAELVSDNGVPSPSRRPVESPPSFADGVVVDENADEVVEDDVVEEGGSSSSDSSEGNPASDSAEDVPASVSAEDSSRSDRAEDSSSSDSDGDASSSDSDDDSSSSDSDDDSSSSDSDGDGFSNSAEVVWDRFFKYFAVAMTMVTVAGAPDCSQGFQVKQLADRVPAVVEKIVVTEKELLEPLFFSSIPKQTSRDLMSRSFCRNQLATFIKNGRTRVKNEAEYNCHWGRALRGARHREWGIRIHKGEDLTTMEGLVQQIIGLDGQIGLCSRVSAPAAATAGRPVRLRNTATFPSPEHRLIFSGVLHSVLTKAPPRMDKRAVAAEAVQKYWRLVAPEAELCDKNSVKACGSVVVVAADDTRGLHKALEGRGLPLADVGADCGELKDRQDGPLLVSDGLLHEGTVSGVLNQWGRYAARWNSTEEMGVVWRTFTSPMSAVLAEITNMLKREKKKKETQNQKTRKNRKKNKKGEKNPQKQKQKKRKNRKKNKKGKKNPKEQKQKGRKNPTRSSSK